MIRRLPIYWHVWKLTAVNALQEAFVNRWSNLLFFVGKSLRLAMTLVFLFLIHQNVQQFGGYTTDQMIVFFLTYQFVDLVAQIFYRGVYLFSNQVRSGEFDFLLAKPINPLFRALTGKPDINDAIFFVPTMVITFWILSQLNLVITATSALLYGALLINSVLIITALHILVLVVGVLTTEVDGIVWLYRDLSRLGQFPVSIYFEPMRFALFFLVPIGMMITIPAEILMNLSPTYSLSLAFGMGFTSFVGSLRLWSWSLKRYGSASS